VLASSGQGLQPGDRTPDLPCRAANGDTRLHALLGGGGIVLLSVGTPLPPIEPSLAGDWLVAASAAPQDGYVAGRTYLIRPDAYLSSCVPSAEREQLLTLWD